MTLDLSSVQAKLNWAKSQIHALDADIRLFIKRNPYRVREKPKPNIAGNPNASQADLFEKGRFLEIVLTEPVPRSINAGTGMIIQALRDSLDHLAVALAEDNGAIEPTDVYFPVCDTYDGFLDKRARRKIKRLSQPDRDIVEALKPYGGGNDALYALHWLNNKSKHRKLIAIATQPHSMQIGGHGCARRLLILPPGNTLCPEEQIICIDADREIQLNFSASVAFSEIRYASRQPVIETLDEFSRLCNSIIELFVRARQ